MFKQFSSLWRDGSIMRNVISALADMVHGSHDVCAMAWSVCSGEKDIDGSFEAIRTSDKKVNEGEREVRRMIVEHLSINPDQDASGCLAVMIMAKDVERIGDHGRNIFDVVRLGGMSVKDFAFFERLDQAWRNVEPQFEKLHQAVTSSDEKLAHGIIDGYQASKKELKGIYKDAFSADFKDSREAVATPLITRFLMRINAHMGNVSSGVIFPVENIDFVSRGLKQEEKDR